MRCEAHRSGSLGRSAGATQLAGWPLMRHLVDSYAYVPQAALFRSQERLRQGASSHTTVKLIATKRNLVLAAQLILVALQHLARAAILGRADDALLLKQVDQLGGFAVADP